MGSYYENLNTFNPNTQILLSISWSNYRKVQHNYDERIDKEAQLEDNNTLSLYIAFTKSS